MKPGAVLNHGIAVTDAGGRAQGPPGGDFIDRHVFPGGELPHVSRFLHDLALSGLEPIDIAGLLGRRAPTLRVPHGAILPIAYAAEMAARVTGREPFVSLDSLRMSKHLMFYSSREAEEELGYRARSYLRALEDALDWFETRHYVPMKRLAAGAMKQVPSPNRRSD